ncbi:hypothetical protein PSHT_10156 [Puccinia striiformis]|uniref:Uncharacterized protein n=1 Tax=Puccinia striiformis TaxID=27350 RepID=A0A2S4VBY2_9BASI|nr:hypothetical protein PSHT_10156 [Puccinia striiformis]
MLPIPHPTHQPTTTKHHHPPANHHYTPLFFPQNFKPHTMCSFLAVTISLALLQSSLAALIHGTTNISKGNTINCSDFAAPPVAPPLPVHTATNPFTKTFPQRPVPTGFGQVDPSIGQINQGFSQGDPGFGQVNPGFHQGGPNLGQPVSNLGQDLYQFSRGGPNYGQVAFDPTPSPGGLDGAPGPYTGANGY